MDRTPEGKRSVPGWAVTARNLFKALMTVWAVLYLALGLAWVGSKAFGYDLPDPLGSSGVVFGAFVAFAAAAGALWLLGEGVAGFKSDD